MADDIKTKVSEILASHVAAPCACGMFGNHAVCPECGKHTHSTVDNGGRCPCIDPRDGKPAMLRAYTASTLTPWDVEFLSSVSYQLSRKRARPLSSKQSAIVEKIIARQSAPAARKSTATRDALDVSPKRGRTWRAMVKAMRYSLVTFEERSGCNHEGTPHGAVYTQAGGYAPGKPGHWFGVDDDGTADRCPVCGRSRVYAVPVDMTAQDPPRDVVAAVREDIRAQISDVTGYDKLTDAADFSDAMRVLPAKHPIAKVLESLLDWHKYAVNVGILVLAS